MKNVLIPTDFTPRSLELVNKTAEALHGDKFNVILFHAFNLPDDIMDLMFMGRERIYKGLVTDDFRSHCKKIKNLYFETINSVCVKYMYGNTVRVFKNFADANDIDLIVCPESIQLINPHKYSIHPVSFFKKSGIKIISSFDALPAKPQVTVVAKEKTFQLTRI